MNSSPELPLLFLLNQLVLAVILLHASALVSKKVEIPQLDLKTAKKLTPVTLVPYGAEQYVELILLSHVA